MTGHGQPRRRSAPAEVAPSLDVGRVVAGHRHDRPACSRRSRPATLGSDGSRRFGAILSVLRDIDTAPPDVDGFSWLLESISRMLRADQAVLILRNPLTEKMDYVLYNHDPRMCTNYADYYWRLDPTHLGDQIAKEPSSLPHPPARMVFDLRDRLDYDKLVSTEFYNDFFRPADIHYDLLATVSADEVRGALCLFRSRHRRPFSSEEAAAMELVAPFVCNHARRAVEADLAALVETTRDRGVVVCDPRGRVLYCNDLARDLCLPLVRPNDDPSAGPDARPAHASAAADDPRRAGASPVAAGSFLDLDALSSVCTVDITDRDVDRGGKGAARVVTLAPRSGRVWPRTEVLQDRFALSDREIEVLRCVTDGATNREIAQKLFITERTVKWHMQRIAGKVGVRTRTAIVHAVHEAVARSAQT